MWATSEFQYHPAIANFLFLRCLTEIGRDLTHSLPLISASRLNPSMSLASLLLHSVNWARAAWDVFDDVQLRN